MKIVPEKRPQIKRDDLIAKVQAVYPDYDLPKLLWVGIRGYYKRTMGDPTTNDRAIYDDAIFIIGESEFITYNANCDPSRFTRGIANLKPGIWPAYMFDKHRGQYLALCQRAARVTVIRDGKGEDTGMFGINIHRGGNYGTSSAGCQTIPPSQWTDFIDTSVSLAKKYYPSRWHREAYTYILIEE